MENASLSYFLCKNWVSSTKEAFFFVALVDLTGQHCQVTNNNLFLMICLVNQKSNQMY